MLTPSQLSARWKVPQHRLAAWRHEGKRPAYVKVGNDVRYALTEIEAYEAAQTRNSAVPHRVPETMRERGGMHNT